MAQDAITMEKVLKALILEAGWNENTENEYPKVAYKLFFQAMVFRDVTQDARKIQRWWENMALLDISVKINKDEKHVEKQVAKFELKTVFELGDREIYLKRMRIDAEKRREISNV